MKKFLTSFGQVLSSNVISFVISIIASFVLPKYVSVEAYSYIQLYIFYQNYIGVFCFGWIDGIVLRYAGRYYEDLDKRKWGGQFKWFTLLSIVCGILVALYACFFVTGPSKVAVFCLLGVTILFALPCSFFRYLFQATNRIKEYSVSVIVERLTYIILVVILLVFHCETFELYVLADVLGKALSLVYVSIKANDIVWTKWVKFSLIKSEVFENIRAGINLLLANFASLLIIGVVRMAIESQWDITVFGKISLTLSVSNMFMVFIRAISIVIFPMLKRTSAEKLPEIYKTLRLCLIMPMFFLMIFYYPIKTILSLWLPQYADSLNYMAMLLPVCVFESKTSMLIETYLKTYRKERNLLLFNGITVAMSVIFTALSVFVMHNLDFAVLSIILLLAMRSVISELYLERVLSIKLKKDMLLELLITVAFIVFNWYLRGIRGTILYIICFLIYVACSRENLKQLIQTVMSYIKK